MLHRALGLVAGEQGFCAGAGLGARRVALGSRRAGEALKPVSPHPGYRPCAGVALVNLKGELLYANNTAGSATGSGTVTINNSLGALTGSGTIVSSNIQITGGAQVIAGSGGTLSTGKTTLISSSVTNLSGANLTFNLDASITGQSTSIDFGGSPSVTFGASGTSLTEDQLNTALRNIWGSSSGSVDLIVCGGSAKRAINGFGSASRRFESTAETFKNVVNVYETVVLGANAVAVAT